MSRLAAVATLAVIAVSAMLTACSDSTAPSPAAKAPVSAESSSAQLVPTVPSLATFSAPNGYTGNLRIPLGSVACGSVPSIALRSVSVAGPTVFAYYSPYFTSEYAVVETTLRKYLSTGWTSVASRKFTVPVAVAAQMGTTASLADFGLVGPGSYYAWTHITWFGVNGANGIAYQLGDRWITYNQFGDFSATGSVTIGNGFCTIK